jgi:hypothetical protein
VFVQVTPCAERRRVNDTLSDTLSDGPDREHGELGLAGPAAASGGGEPMGAARVTEFETWLPLAKRTLSEPICPTICPTALIPEGVISMNVIAPPDHRNPCGTSSPVVQYPTICPALLIPAWSPQLTMSSSRLDRRSWLERGES